MRLPEGRSLTCCDELHRHRLLILYLASQSFKELGLSRPLQRRGGGTTSVNVAVSNLPSDAFALTRFFTYYFKNYLLVFLSPFSDWERKGINHSLLRKMFFEDLFSLSVNPTSSKSFYHSFYQELLLKNFSPICLFRNGLQRYYLYLSQPNVLKKILHSFSSKTSTNKRAFLIRENKDTTTFLTCKTIQTFYQRV